MAQQSPQPAPATSSMTTAIGSGVHRFDTENFDVEQMFELIDRLLPFEVCLYHQVLPIRIDDHTLMLGAVCPEDASSLAYVKQMLAHTRYTITLHPISAQLQQHFLSAFLNYDRQIKASNSDLLLEDHGPRIAHDGDEVEAPTIPMEDLRRSNNGRDNGDESDPSQFQEDFEAALNAESDGPTNHSSPVDIRREPEHSAGIREVSLPVNPLPPVLNVNAPHADRELSTLGHLAPRLLAQELIQRAIVQGIGRLYLERQGDTGRVLCSQDGVLQAALEDIDHATFQGVINELKLLGNLPLAAIERPRQVEIERRYEGELLLLRLRIVPGQDGEEGTLQVLRGAALKFYQQQQLSKLSQDALSLARRLQKQVAEIHARARLTPTLGTDRVVVLPELKSAVSWLSSMLDSLD